MIAGAFHRTGAVEVWGRGTNRVIAMCRKHGAAAPTFEERQGFLIVTFKAEMVAAGVQVESKAQLAAELAPGRDQVGTKSGLSRDQVEVLRLCRQEQPLVAMMNAAGRQNRTKFRDGLVKPLIEAGLLELTIPEKPRSRLQKYRLTPAGQEALKMKAG